MEPTSTERVLAAFAVKPRMCLVEIADITGLGVKAVAATVRELAREGLLQSSTYFSRKGEAYVPLQIGLDNEHLPMLLGLDEREARNRIVMVKRMKERLVIDYHPMLDLVIGDYESGLKKVEAIRYGVDGV